ncbi:MAG: 50S ribosome-binding GTPase [Gammaproteobacteria bacterium]|nr:50S ribosome-binding GTPase [Gammaproteobacteria bacterium]
MNRRAALYVALAASLLPLLLLLPLGAVWLFQHGWLTYWLLAAAVLGVATYGLTRWLGRTAESAKATDTGPVAGPNPDFSPLDLAAWQSVQAVAREVDPAIVFDRDQLLQTARITIDAVARHYHPEARHPVWRFTLPELFMLTERVSGRLRRVLLAEVPGSHLMRVGDAVRLWEFKPLLGRGAKVVKGLNLVWRVARLVNPASALLAEARERLIGAALGDAGNWIQRRGARMWVEEVGRAAIELYSGRLELDAAELEAADHLGDDIQPAATAGPVRLVIAGQTNAGKSSLINTLLDTRAAGVDVLPHTAAFESHELARDGQVEVILIDSPGLDTTADIQTLSDLAWNADALLWVTAGHRADRSLDRVALDAIRARFAAEPRRRMPPVRVLVTHIDRLSPAREWSPPYDLDAASSPKARNIAESLTMVASDLAMAPERLLPVRLQPEATRYNVELIWPAVAEDLDDAHRARLLRLTLQADRKRWRRLLEQAGAAGRTLWHQKSG